MEFDLVKKLDKDREMFKDASFSSNLSIQAQQEREDSSFDWEARI